MKNKIIGLIIIANMLLTFSCATAPSTSDLILKSANDTQAKADLQKKLAKDIDRGSKTIKEGQDQFKEGVVLQEKGNKKINEGGQIVENAKKTLSTIFPEINLEPVK